MANLKYSRQRAAIKEYLCHTTEHPTADTVYLHIREAYPNISLGTVYRNLNLLADTGEAIKISTPDGGDRFDGRTYLHYHLKGPLTHIPFYSTEPVKIVWIKNPK